MNRRSGLAIWHLLSMRADTNLVLTHFHASLTGFDAKA